MNQIVKTPAIVVDGYLTVISAGPLMIVSMPYVQQKRRDDSVSERRVMPWHNVTRAITTVMRSHGFKLKDVYAVERMGPANATPEFEAEWAKTLTRLEAAFSGDPSILPEFWLYKWKNDGFEIVRRGTPPMTTAIDGESR